MPSRFHGALLVLVPLMVSSCRFLTVKECEKDSDCTGYNQCNTDTWRCFLPPLPEEVVESGFKMEQHAFSFPNFSGRDPDSTMTAELMQRMFGKSAVCAAEAGTCRVKPGPKEFQRLINLALQGGRCEGFAIFSDLLFQGEMSPADFGAQNAAGIVIDNLDVKEELAYWFASQYLFDVVTDTTRSLDAEGLVRVLAAEFAKPQHPMYRLGISRIGEDGKRTGGHAVVPIAVVPKGEDRFVIKLYDNNHPGHEREMLVDVGSGTWEYQASANPESQTSRYVGNPDNGNLVYLAEAPPRMGRHPCAFCAGSTEEAKHIFASGGTSLNATDEAGNSSGEVDGKLVSAIPGSVVTPVFSAENHEDRTDMQMVLPAGDSMKLSMRSAGSEGDGQEDSIRVFGPGTVIGVSNMGLEEGEEATLTWDKESDDVTYTPASPSGATITVSTTTSDGKEVSVSVTLPEDKDTDSVTMDVEEESGNPSVKVDSGTNEDTTVTMNVVRSDAESEDTLEASVDVPEDGSAEVDVENWEGDGHPAAVEVDNTGDGVPDQTVVVDDTGPAGTPPAAPSNLVATAISNALIRLTWTDNANNEDGIQIERDTGSGFVALTSLPANTVSYDDTAVQINSTYVYRVRASNPYGQSDYTTPAEAITPGCGPGLQDNDGDKVCQEACAVDTTCNGHGTCLDASGAVVCTCATEYSGARCDACATGYQDNDSNGTCTAACNSSMCGSHGTCSDTTGTATCTCETGWGGPECGGCAAGYQDNDSNGTCTMGCQLENCNNHGTCEDGTGTAVCTCAAEYAGTQCETCALNFQDNDGDTVCTPACSTNICNTGACDDSTGVILCQCGPEYTGTYCESCAPAFQDNDGNKTCTPDCTQWGCQGHGTCADATGTAVCACAQEYTGPHCESCAQGFQDLDGDGICAPDMPTCTTETCGPHGSCNTNPTPGNICICLTGYAGLHCETCATGYQDNDNDTICTPNCDGVTCSGRGLCTDVTGTATCVCETGYAPPDCSTCAQGYQDDDQDGICMTVCNPASCNGHGTCDGSTGVEVCTCEVGYAQPDCKGCAVGYQDRNLDGICLPDCSGETCSGHGTCDDITGTATCTCTSPEYAGVHCETCAQGYQDLDGDFICTPDCTMETCSGQGVCVDTSGTALCSCNLGYGGDYCEQCALGYQDNDLDKICQPDCSSLNCEPNGVCSDSNGPATCSCTGLWSGPTCSICPSPAIQVGNACAATSCASIKKIQPTAPSGLYDIRPGVTVHRVYCDMDTDGGGWTLVSKFTQANESFGAMDLATYDTYFSGVQWMLQGTTPPTSPDPVYTQRAIESIPWSEMLQLGGLTAGGIHQLRQTFYADDRQDLMDVSYTFTFNGHLLQDTAIGTDRAWLLRGRNVLADTTGIAWDGLDTPARFWLPFTSAATGELYNGCGGFNYSTTACDKDQAYTRRFGNAGIIGATADGVDQAAGWGPHTYYATGDVVHVEQADNRFGVSGRNMVLMYWLRDVDSCASPQATCDTNATCDDIQNGTAQCVCKPGFIGSYCETCLPGTQDNDHDGVCQPDCSGQTCSGNGTCDDSTGTAVCQCTGFHEGPNCENCGYGLVPVGALCMGRTCAEYKRAIPTLTSGLYDVYPTYQESMSKKVYCDMETDGGGWMLVTKFTQAGGPFGNMDQPTYDSLFANGGWVQLSTPPQSPDPDYSATTVESWNWNSAVVRYLGGVYQLRQTFYALDRQDLFDVAYAFNWYGTFEQEQAPETDRSWVLRNRTVLADTTGIAWDTDDVPERFWLPFRTSTIGLRYSSCNGYDLSPSTNVCASWTTPGRIPGSAGIIGSSADNQDPAASGAPYTDTGSDVVRVHQALAKYGNSGRNMVLMYWLREVVNCASPNVSCGMNGTCGMVNGTALCECKTGFAGALCDRCAPGYTGPECTRKGSVSSGTNHACAITGTGISCWGSNSQGALGVPDQPLASAAPTLNLGSSPAVEVSSGDQFNCAVFADKTVRCWGNNSAMQTRGTAGANVPAGSGDAIPAPLNVGGPVRQVATGADFACVLREDRNVRCWGANDVGQCGLGVATNPLPLDSAGDLIPYGFNQICAGSRHACALNYDGLMWCWGEGLNGAIGNGNTDNIGDNEQLGSAVQVFTNAEYASGIRVQAIACGGSQTCAILTNGVVRCFGENAEGELGQGNTLTVGDDELPNTVGAIAIGGTVLQVTLGDHVTCALLENGTAKCWGWVGKNPGGCLGHGPGCTGNVTTPPVTSIGFFNSSVRELGLRSVSGTLCARMEDRGVYCWSDNTLNACGLNTATNPIDPPSTTYTLLPSVCGNTTLEYGEQCDDGNTVTADACNNQCQINSYADLCWPDAMGGSAQCVDVCSAAGRNWTGQWNCDGPTYTWCTSQCVCGCQLP